MPRRMLDEEDVAQSALHSFFRGVKGRRFPRLDDRDDLWQVLLMIADRKATSAKRQHFSQKRGAGRVRGESAMQALPGREEGPQNMDWLVGREPTPEFACEMAELFENRLTQLGDPQLRRIALWKMEGYTTAEIADRLGRAPRSVERMLQLIRAIWSEEVGT